MKTNFKKLLATFIYVASCIAIASCSCSNSNSDSDTTSNSTSKSAVGTYREYFHADRSIYRTYVLNANGSAKIISGDDVKNTYWEYISGGDVRIKGDNSWKYIDFGDGMVYHTYDCYRSHANGGKFSKIN